jgi:predicted membrane protein
MNADNNDMTQKHQFPLEKESRGSASGRFFAGLIIISIGSVLLATKLGIEFPYWLLSWRMLVLAIGLYVGFRHGFRGPVWIVMVIIGSTLFLDMVAPELHFHDYIWPLIIIMAGLSIMFRPRHKRKDWRRKWEEKMSKSEHTDNNDFLDSVTIFGSLKKNIFSKNFKGGDITTIFGGTELNLTQADMDTPAELDITQIFGGAKLVIPPHWRIKTEDIVSIFGGVEDKRPILPETSYDQTKILVLKGTNIFGGIDIKSY